MRGPCQITVGSSLDVEAHPATAIIFVGSLLTLEFGVPCPTAMSVVFRFQTWLAGGPQ